MTRPSPSETDQAAAGTPRADPVIGRALGNGAYRVRGVLARGATATIYRARGSQSTDEVAVKVLAPPLSSDPGHRARFLNEAACLDEHRHPNLIATFEHGVDDGRLYLVMPLAPRGSVRRRLANAGGPLDPVFVARVVEGVARGLQHVHDRGLVHLDVKPSNVLLGPADWPLLADFGLARSRSTDARRSPIPGGTPAYMAPEQCRGAEVDERSDQYALAATAFELLTGRPPFPVRSIAERLGAGDRPPAPRALNRRLPVAAESVLLRALSPDPAERYPTVRDFGRDLAAALEGERGVTADTKSRLVAAALTVAALLGVSLTRLLALALAAGSAGSDRGVGPDWIVQAVFAVVACVLLLRLSRSATALIAAARARLGDLAGWLAPDVSAGCETRRPTRRAAPTRRGDARGLAGWPFLAGLSLALGPAIRPAGQVIRALGSPFGNWPAIVLAALWLIGLIVLWRWGRRLAVRMSPLLDRALFGGRLPETNEELVERRRTLAAAGRVLADLAALVGCTYLVDAAAAPLAAFVAFELVELSRRLRGPDARTRASASMGTPAPTQ